MGEKNSTETRVKPLFDFIDSDINKLNQLLGMFDKNQKIEKDSLIKIQYKDGKNGEKEERLPPSKSLLIWMLKNLNELNKEKNYDTKSISKETVEKTLDEAIRKINSSSKLPNQAWYIFEGVSSPDIFIETTNSIYVGEGKRTEPNTTTNTTWLKQRDQLIRYIDSLLDQPKNIYSFYILEKETYLKRAYAESMKLYSSKDYFNQNLRHRDEVEILRAFNSYIGFLFWEDIADYFKISFPDFPDKI